MCIVLFAYKSWPGYHLVLAANRDEFLQRPTAPLQFWQDNHTILAGRDLQAGGTWLGVTTSGKLGVVTNYREPALMNGQYGSRGKIIPDFLGSPMEGDPFLKQLERTSQFRGVNILLADGDSLYYASNRTSAIKKLTPGLYGLSNHLLDTPWPKVELGKRCMGQLVREGQVDVEELFNLLQDERRPEEKDLPDTGIGREWERLLSSVFISSPVYGTRSSAVILIAEDGQCQFHERRFDHDEEGWNETGRDMYHIAYSLN